MSNSLRTVVLETRLLEFRQINCCLKSVAKNGTLNAASPYSIHTYIGLLPSGHRSLATWQYTQRLLARRNGRNTPRRAHAFLSLQTWTGSDWSSRKLRDGTKWNCVNVSFDSGNSRVSRENQRSPALATIKSFEFSSFRASFGNGDKVATRSYPMTCDTSPPAARNKIPIPSGSRQYCSFASLRRGTKSPRKSADRGSRSAVGRVAAVARDP